MGRCDRREHGGGWSVEYAYASQQLEERILRESVQQQTAHVLEVEQILAAALSSLERQAALDAKLDEIAGDYEIRFVGLFDAEGRALGVSGQDIEAGQEVEALDPAKVRSVVSSQQPFAGIEEDEGESGQEGRYEFLLPVSSSDGPMVLEVDQHAGVVGALLADLRQRKALGLLASILCAIPLSYLLGGRNLQRRYHLAERMADTDALTGLAGRRPFRPALEAALTGANADAVALALIDIDEFKQVNDRLGHTYGDRVLVAMAGSFAALRASDTAFRLGGDEFAVMLPHTNDEQAQEVLERVRAAMAERSPGVTFSCGIASARSGDAVTMQELWERADAALYEAKRRGRRQTITFTDTTSPLTISVDKLDAVRALLDESTALGVAFQPIWDLHRGSVLGHEALLRLPAAIPIDGPQEAFDLAQRLGLAADLDQRARHAVLQSIRRQDWHGLLFINIHPDALRSLDVETFAAEVTDAGLEPADVILEVTEQAGLDHPEPIRVLNAPTPSDSAWPWTTWAAATPACGH